VKLFKTFFSASEHSGFGDRLFDRVDPDVIVSVFIYEMIILTYILSTVTKILCVSASCSNEK